LRRRLATNDDLSPSQDRMDFSGELLTSKETPEEDFTEDCSLQEEDNDFEDLSEPDDYETYEEELLKGLDQNEVRQTLQH
jgi:hypothetical protein